MAAEGLVLKDLMPVPDTDPTEREGKSTTIIDAPSESHELALGAAKAAHEEEKGAAELKHEKEVVNLGWNEPKEHVQNPLVGGLSNEELWLLVRRFNKVRLNGNIATSKSLIDCSKCTMSKRSRQCPQEGWI